MIDGTIARAAGVLLVCGLAACDKPAAKQAPASGSATVAATTPPPPPAADTPPAAAPGRWYRAALTYKDIGELGFFLQLPPAGTNGRAHVLNDDETTDFTAEWQGNEVTVTGPWTYTSVIKAKLDPDSGALAGSWTRDTPLWGKVERPFTATPIERPDPALRFASTGSPAANVSGTWKFEFDHHKAGKGQLEQTPDGVVTGYVRPGQLGDVRILGGKLTGKQLALSHFNGNSANLIVAEVSPDGTSMSGTMSMQNVWNEKFTAKKVEDFEHAKKVRLKKGHKTVTLKGLDKYKGKPTIAMIFATWCPSCNDATPYLKKLYETYHSQGLEMIGVSYDLSEDEAQTRVQVDRYREKYKLPWELTSVMCTTDDWAQAMPPELEGWDGLPILMLVRADGTVQTTYGGWFGPTTGADGEKLRAWFEEEVKLLLASKP